MVTWSKPAIDDLKLAFEYIEKDSRFYAERLGQIAVQKSESLMNFQNTVGLFRNFLMKILEKYLSIHTE